MTRLLRFPSAITIDTFAKGRVELLKFEITHESVLHNMMIADISTKLHCDILICAIERNEEVIIPAGHFILREKDKVTIVASSKNSSEFFKKLAF